MISVQDLRRLEDIFAEPWNNHVDIVWLVPAWLAYLQQKLGQPVMPSFYVCWRDSHA